MHVRSLFAGILVVMLLAPSVRVQGEVSQESALDYGDAPDRAPTGYTAGAALGLFPSRLASDGARHENVSVAWLGPNVDVESDSRQVDLDLFDDSVRDLQLVACETSRLIVEVSAEPAARGSLLFLNALFDWNRDGMWVGGDDCAPEWAIQNVPIDPSLWPDDATSQPVSFEFRAGAQVSELWYRLTLTVDETVSSWEGAGSFALGETEDYFISSTPHFPPPPPPTEPPVTTEPTPTPTPTRFITTGGGTRTPTPPVIFTGDRTPTPTPGVIQTGNPFTIACQPDPLSLVHGQEGVISIVTTSAPDRGRPITWQVLYVARERPTDQLAIDPGVDQVRLWLGVNQLRVSGTVIDPPERVETFIIMVGALSDSWAATVECHVTVSHTFQTPSTALTPTATPTRVIFTEPSSPTAVRTASPTTVVRTLSSPQIKISPAPPIPANTRVTIDMAGLTPNRPLTQTLCLGNACETTNLMADAAGLCTNLTGPLAPGRYRVEVMDPATGLRSEAFFDVASP